MGVEQPHPWSFSRSFLPLCRALASLPMHLLSVRPGLLSSLWVHGHFSQANPEAGLVCSSARPPCLAAWNPLAPELRDQ